MKSPDPVDARLAVLPDLAFRSAASVWSRAPCPGVLTGLLVYLPLSLFLADLAVREGLLSPFALLAGLCIAVAFHALEVGHNVFERW